MNKKIFFLSAVLFNFTIVSTGQQEQRVEIKTEKQKKMKLLVVVLGHAGKELQTASYCIAEDLTCVDQCKAGFDITVEHQDIMPRHKQIKLYYEKGYPLVLFVDYTPVKKTYNWRLYDTQRVQMLIGKNVQLQRFTSAVMAAHHIANGVWESLTGQEGCFGSYVAYCKQEHKNKNSKSLVVRHAHSNSYEEERMLISKSNIFAPRWNQDAAYPLILYSEATLSNVRLLSIDMHGHHRVVSNFEGLNMLPSFSSDGQKIVYCLSRDGSSQLYMYMLDPVTGKALLKRLTNNKANNVSPTLRDNGDIIFCSDFQNRGPQVCYYHADTKEVEHITQEGYCTSPSFCEKKDMIAYSKLVNGTMQLFVYDYKKKDHRQITFDEANKEECTWSPCGNYVSFSWEDQKESKIAMMNLITQEQFFITKNGGYYSFPSWSHAAFL
jgi:TolB protein